MVEHLTFNQVVLGSSPSALTTHSDFDFPRVEPAFSGEWRLPTRQSLATTAKKRKPPRRILGEFMLVKPFPILLIFTAATFSMNSKPVQARSAHASLRAECVKQVGAYYDPGRRAYVVYGASSSAQMQNFYNCLDSGTMKRSRDKKR